MKNEYLEVALYGRRVFMPRNSPGPGFCDISRVRLTNIPQHRKITIEIIVYNTYRLIEFIKYVQLFFVCCVDEGKSFHNICMHITWQATTMTLNCPSFHCVQ